MSRLVVASNRVGDPRTSAGGLAVALSNALSEHGGVWFGWSGKTVEGDRQDLVTREIDGITLATTDLTQAEHDDYYLGFSNQVLWPVLHYRLDLVLFEDRFLDAYRRVNQLFASRLRPLLKPDDIIWVHDYHLIPLGAELRHQGVGNALGYFLHIPVPSPDLLRAIPDVEWLVRSCFAYDVVGFQTVEHREHFIRYVVEQAGGERLSENRLRAYGRTICVDAYPIGIEYKQFAALAHTPEARYIVTRMRQRNLDRPMIIGVDRLDYSKGLLQRYEAFRRLLDVYPQQRNNVIFMQIAPPSRGDVIAYADMRRELEQLAGHINGEYGGFEWTPIRYIHRKVDRDTLAALYHASRVGLVTPLRDGMILVAKEYVAAQNPLDPGVLVLSKFAGAAEQMTEAVLVNPYDPSEVAEALQKALSLDLESRRRMHERLIEVVRDTDVHLWCERFLSDLKQAAAAETA